MSRRLSPLFLFALLLSLSFAIPQRAVFAATLSAGTAAELVDAIIVANGTPQADTIILTNNITLTAAFESDSTSGATALPTITGTLTIEGQGFVIERDMNAPLFRILRVAAGAQLSLSNMTIRYGNQRTIMDYFISGGGIYSQGTLTVRHVTFYDNISHMGGAILSDGGVLTVLDSTFSNNAALDYGTSGGGILTNDSNVTISDSVFIFNYGGSGGGVAVGGGIATLTNDVFDQNNATEGGGFVSFSADVTIRGSTFMSNRASGIGGGIYHWSGAMDISNSTFSANAAPNNKDGDAIYNDIHDPLTIRNTTIAGNQDIAVDGRDISFTNTIITRTYIYPNCVGVNLSGSFSLSDDDSCPGFVNSSTINLAGLVDNGGATPTIALNSGSSALDSADNTTCLSDPVNGVDQRGVARGIDGDGTMDSPQSGDCDIGAFESGGIIRTLQFATANSAFNLRSGLFPVTLTLDNPLPNGYGPVTAYIWVSSGTALVGTDYAPFGVQTVTFSPGDRTQTVMLNVLDTSPRPGRTVMLSFATTHGLGFRGPAQLGAQLTHEVVLLSPDDAAPPLNYVYTHTPTLTWTSVTGATGYEIEVSADKTFKLGDAFHDAAIPADRLYATPINPQANGTYYWRVRAQYADGSHSAWSATEMFVIGT